LRLAGGSDTSAGSGHRVPKKTLTKQVNAKAGTNTLTWKLPKSLKAGKYTLRLLYEGRVKASAKVKIAR
jgi:uncharacterized protein YfaS (alpha-2-macroglobulin family)